MVVPVNSAGYMESPDDQVEALRIAFLRESPTGKRDPDGEEEQHTLL